MTWQIEDAEERWIDCDLTEDTEDHVACATCGTHLPVEEASDDRLCAECAPEEVTA